jgi:hypothetical protein
MTGSLQSLTPFPGVAPALEGERVVMHVIRRFLRHGIQRIGLPWLDVERSPECPKAVQVVPLTSKPSAEAV